jgi:uncharacterized protein (TIGR03066 family)
MQLFLTFILCLFVSAALLAADKDKNSPSKSSGSGSSSKTTISKDKLIGAWELDDNSSLGLKGTVYEFTKDKVTMSFKKVRASGSYTLDGDKLHWTMGQGSVVTESLPTTITKLTDKEMVLEVKDSKITLTKK